MSDPGPYLAVAAVLTAGLWLTWRALRWLEQ